MGTVYGDGDTLPYANVIVSATLHTISDENGDFEMDSPAIKANTPVKFTYVGFEDQTFPASELTGKSITLPVSAEQLEEVIIYGNKVPKPVAESGNKLLTHIKKHKTLYAVGASVALMLGSLLLIKKANA